MTATIIGLQICTACSLGEFPSLWPKQPSGAVQVVFSDRRWACGYFRGSVTASEDNCSLSSKPALLLQGNLPIQAPPLMHSLPGFPRSQGAAWILLSFLLLSLALLLPCTFRSISCTFSPPKLGKGFPWVPPVTPFWPLSKYCSISLPLKWAVNKGVN